MQKVIVIGSPGAGKSVFARKLREKTGLPLYYLDLPWVEQKFDGEFRQWILDFPKDQLPCIYELLEQYSAGREVCVFRCREEADIYISGKPEDT